MGFFETVYYYVKLIPHGKVATYGQIASLAGRPRMSQIVGWALHQNPEPGVIPCHRVIFKTGKLCEGFAFGGLGVQKAMLESEGIVVGEDDRVNLEVYGWDGAV